MVQWVIQDGRYAEYAVVQAVNRIAEREWRKPGRIDPADTFDHSSLARQSP
jgi:hypothetical protein